MCVSLRGSGLPSRNGAPARLLIVVAERRYECVSGFGFAPVCEIASQSVACGPGEVLVSADLGEIIMPLNLPGRCNRGHD